MDIGGKLDQELKPQLLYRVMGTFKQFIEGYEFSIESRGAHHGQTDLTLYAKENNEIVGKIEYCEFENKPFVQWIEVNPNHRREGIATALAKELQKMYPNEEIEWSNTTPNGTKFVKSLPTRYSKNPQHEKLKKEWLKLKKNYAVLEKEIKKWYDGTYETGYNRDEFMKIGDKMNSIDQHIWEIEQELRDISPGKRRIQWNE